MCDKKIFIKMMHDDDDDENDDDENFKFFYVFET